MSTRTTPDASGPASARPEWSAAGHHVANAEVARLLRAMADVLEVERENPFRVLAYRGAARTVESLPEPIAAILTRAGPEGLEALPGIGEDLAGKIAEIEATGRFQALEREMERAPKGAVALMRVRGIGPQRAHALVEALDVHSLDELQEAAQSGKVRAVPGFGRGLERRILAELKGGAAEAPRMLRATAASYADPIVTWLREAPGVEGVEVAGSFRRCRETVGDLDVLVSAEQGAPVAERFVAYPGVAEVLARGETRCTVRLHAGLQVDLRVVPAASFGAALHYFTGSLAHNVAMRRMAQGRGLKLNEYGLFRGKRRIAGTTEAEIYAALDLPWIPPELREDRGEFGAARAGRLPTLVTQDQLLGDLQCHTTDSDGRDTLEAMADAAEALGYEYLAVTDHTHAVRVTGGMDRAGFRKQRRRIDRLNAGTRACTILAGAEVDILPDGTLDLEDVTLESLDVVVVSMHLALDLPPAQQTKRLVKALQHPYVDILGHPTGRLINRRRAAAFDFELVCRVAHDHGVMFEVNAQPERLDLDDAMARLAIERGVMLTLGTDAHATRELGLMRWGVDQARRGWATAADVANTLALPELLARLHGGR